MGCSSSKEARAGKAAKEKHASVGSSTLITDDNQAGNAEKEAMSRGRTNTMNKTTDPDVITALPPRTPVQIHALDGHSNVSRPPPPPRILQLSELIDPAELEKWPIPAVRSPSGNSMMAPGDYIAHPGRPRSIRERQETIKERVRAAGRLAEEREALKKEAPAKGDGGKAKGKRLQHSKKGAVSAKATTGAENVAKKQSDGALDGGIEPKCPSGSTCGLCCWSGRGSSCCTKRK